MCLINFAYKCHPQFDLILAANRDEFFIRPTEQAGYWTEFPGLIAGKDLEQGGTWLGITTNGKIAALTNYREVREKSNEKSRGGLVLDYLKSEIDPVEYLKIVKEFKDNYLGFNLLSGTVEDLYYFSNRENVIRKLEPGIHSVSNALLNTSWPKVERGKTLIEQAIKEEQGDLVARLLASLTNDEKAEEQYLPNTGVGLELEKQLSSVFINMGGYGTRCSTVVTISKSKQVTFCERTYVEGQDTYDDRSFAFTIK
ncbi:NRDE family protein [Alkalihalobacterium alkalinitrilicum]|uniref:NRDE family protein n=1 Tax=Alkalihalobacterium alkalinitrilicum TaxID=427920 RepID=UPI000995B55B|nr:NRDE family protein [Alkalihalobacterium alkalinitrilicum]